MAIVNQILLDKPEKSFARQEMLSLFYLDQIKAVSIMDFMARLYELRENTNMKQIELAELVSLKSGAISKYEKGVAQPCMETIIRFAEIFHVSVDYLLGVSSIPNPYTVEQFSPQETDIILRYRRLSRENQIRIDERINTMLDQTQNML